MAVNLADTPELVTPGDLGDELASFMRSMRAKNVSPNTILAYGGAVRQFGRWLLDNDLPTDIATIDGERVNAWIISILQTSKPATAHNRWRGLQRFFNWYAGKLDERNPWRSPMAKLQPPRLPKLMPRVLTMEDLRAILGATAGHSFEDRRDNALIRLLFDTGARRHEIAALRYSPTDPEDRDVDLRRSIVVLTRTKGDKDNRLPFSDRTAEAIEDYLRARKHHPHKDEPWLWLGRKGQLTDSGIAQAIRDRGKRVGITNLHAHDFRHAATHHELAAGMREADVMAKRGWDSAAMLRRYASTTANQRMIEASRRLGLGDKL